MSEDAERIRQQMQNVRQDMGAGVQGVVHGARQLSDWRYYVRKHPWACVGSAFALGFLATPARKKLFAGNMDMTRLVEQLKTAGAGAGLTGGATAAGGIPGRVLAFLGPILLQNAASLVAQHFAGGDHAAPADAASPPPNVP